MSNVQAETLARHLCALSARPDQELVSAFAAGRNEQAFEALVRRHGPMVLRVCRRVLGGLHDAEDAFQATFLVLARSARALRRRESVANWLYGVAYRLALRARSDAARRRAREARAALPPVADPLAELTVREAQGAFDEELARLPERLRAPLVLCCLEGLTRDEAARQLGCPPTTLKGRLEQARGLLRGRLVRRGLTLPAGLLASLLAEGAAAQAGMPAPFLPPVVRAALLYAAGGAVRTGAGSAAARLADGYLRGSAAGRLAVAAALVMLLGVGGGAALVAGRDPGAAPAQLAAPEPPRSAPEAAAAADWPQWRGPNRDGVVHGAAAPAKWPWALTEEWKVAVGPGVASPVVVGDRVYLLTRQKDDEFVLCLDLPSGKENWRSEPYPAPYKAGPGEGTADDRPRSTPAVADGRVFTLGMTGIFSCLDARTGKLLWRKDTRYTYYGGSSPLVADGLCVAHVGDGVKTGGLTAFDVRSGDVKWCFADGASATSGSPILVDLAGERQLVTYSNWNACGVSLTTGKRLWGVLPSGAGMPCTTPLRYKDLLILADNMDSLRALRLERGDKGITARQVWKSRDDLKLYYSSPVVVGDRVFGMSTRNGGCFFCLDAASGKVLWESEGRQGGYASFVSLGSVLLLLKDRGQLLVVKPSGAAFEAIAEYRVSDRGTLAHPVFLGDRILIRDDLTLRSFRIGPDAGQE
ncbi:MAG TPA: sigma-70 family RNA polymerase sigma factor [Gemmataceae bacterium]|nr:sigma-70 family RNA polymerase sigma factor [Gemmataceae bacterium]